MNKLTTKQMTQHPPLPSESNKTHQYSNHAQTPLHTVEVAGDVWIWYGQLIYGLKRRGGWINFAAFDASLVSTKIMSAPSALLAQHGRRQNSVRLINNRKEVFSFSFYQKLREYLWTANWQCSEINHSIIHLLNHVICGFLQVIYGNFLASSFHERDETKDEATLTKIKNKNKML